MSKFNNAWETFIQNISDQSEQKNNPNIRILSITCDDCGIWNSSGCIRRKVKFSPKANEILKNKSIHTFALHYDTTEIGKGFIIVIIIIIIGKLNSQ